MVTSKTKKDKNAKPAKKVKKEKKSVKKTENAQVNAVESQVQNVKSRKELVKTEQNKSDNSLAKSSEPLSQKINKRCQHIIDALKLWFKGIKIEFGKIIWPTREQLIGYTIVVLVTLGIVSLYLFILSQGFEGLFKAIGIA